MRSRPYQAKCVDRIFEEWREVRSTLIVKPTGTGKTIVIAKVAKRSFPGRTLVIAHRQELVWQARDKIRQAAGLTVGVEMGEYKSGGSGGLFKKAQVVVSTVQTLTAGGDGEGRIGKFDPEEFTRLIIDEAHHAPASTYKRIIAYFMQNPHMKLLGVTATPDRADEEALGQIFETVAFDYEILDAIHDGWLVPIEQQMVNVDGLDISAVRVTAGDLNGADLAAIMESEKCLQEVAWPTIEIVGDRRALVFTSSVRHAETLSEIFNRHKPGMSAWVCGKTDRDQRRLILSKFKQGDIQVVCNCGVLTEGFDDPGVKVVVMARPTKSRSLYSQMCGRATRPIEAIAHELNDVEDPAERRAMIAESVKPSCLIVDFVGNSGKHKLVTSADVLGGNVSEEAVARATEEAIKSGRPIRMDISLDQQELWVKEKEEKRLADEARRVNLIAKTKFSTQSIDPFDVFQIKPVVGRGWDKGKILSEKQRSLLRKIGVDPDAMPYPAAKQVISEMMMRWDKHLCTLKQAKTLKKFGYSTDMTFDQARITMDAIAANGWRRPAMDPVPKDQITNPRVEAGPGPMPDEVGDEGAPTEYPQDNKPASELVSAGALEEDDIPF